MGLKRNYLAEVYCQSDYRTDTHDEIAEAYCQALQTYNHERGNFGGWVRHKRRGVRTARYSETKRISSLNSDIVSNDAEHEEGSNDWESLDHDFICSPIGVFKKILRMQQRKIIFDLLSDVDKKKKDMIIKRYFQSKGIVQIAKEVGLPKSTVDRKIKKTLLSFRRVLLMKKLQLQDLIA